MASALHDSLRARELYVGAESLGHGEVRAADQQETEFRLISFWTADLRVTVSTRDGGAGAGSALGAGCAWLWSCGGAGRPDRPAARQVVAIGAVIAC